MASEVARFLRDKYSKSLSEVESDLPASLCREFRDIGKQLEDGRFWSSPTPEFISSLYNLNDAVTEWRIFKEQHNDIKKIFHRFGLDQQTKQRLTKIREDLNKPESRVGDYSSSLILGPTRFPSDRYTCFERDPPNISGFGRPQEKMVDWLTAAPEGFKAIGIYGMGGSGKTALVKKVLKNQNVSAKFNDGIVWACLSDLTCKDEIDIRIMKFLLEYLGCDIDGFHGYRDDEVWLMEQLKLKLVDLKNYIVVFDDVWVCNDWFIDLCHKLGEPKKMDPKLELDGAVIVTSRIKEVAEKMVGGKKLIHVNPLDSYKENGKLLEDIVKQNMKDANNAEMVDEIVHHCHGLPHAAKTLPGVIAKPISQWAGQIS